MIWAMHYKTESVATPRPHRTHSQLTLTRNLLLTLHTQHERLPPRRLQEHRLLCRSSPAWYVGFSRVHFASGLTFASALAQGATVTFLLRSPSVFDQDAEMQKYIKNGQARLVKGDTLKKDTVIEYSGATYHLGS